MVLTPEYKGRASKIYNAKAQDLQGKDKTLQWVIRLKGTNQKVLLLNHIDMSFKIFIIYKILIIIYQ